MKSKKCFFFVAVVVACFCSCTSAALKEEIAATNNGTPILADPLPLRYEGTGKKAIIDFVSNTTGECSANFIRIAVRVLTFEVH